MDALFGLLWLATLIGFIAALIKPSIFSGVTKRQHGRKHLLPFFAGAGLICLVGFGATAPPSTNTASKTTTPVVTTKTATSIQPVPFDTQTVDDATLAKGQTTVKQQGVNGVETITYSVTYTDGKETGRKQVSDKVTTAAIPKIIENGTYVAPVVTPAPTTNGNTVPSPTVTNNGGATAQCVDGTYSYSQHASGTCSHHGGVAVWINHP